MILLLQDDRRVWQLCGNSVICCKSDGNIRSCETMGRKYYGSIHPIYLILFEVSIVRLFFWGFRRKLSFPPAWNFHLEWWIKDVHRGLPAVNSLVQARQSLPFWDRYAPLTLTKLMMWKWCWDRKGVAWYLQGWVTDGETYAISGCTPSIHGGCDDYIQHCCHTN